MTIRFWLPNSTSVRRLYSCNLEHQHWGFHQPRLPKPFLESHIFLSCKVCITGAVDDHLSTDNAHGGSQRPNFILIDLNPANGMVIIAVNPSSFEQAKQSWPTFNSSNVLERNNRPRKCTLYPLSWQVSATGD